MGSTAPELPSDLALLGDQPWRDALLAAIVRAADSGLATAGLSRLAQAGGGDVLAAWPAAELDPLAAIVGASPVLTRYLAGFGAGWPAAAATYRRPAPDRADLERDADLAADAVPGRVSEAVRRLARREMYRIGARDLLGLADLPETLAAITLLAEVTIELATSRLRAAMARDRGDVIGIDGAPVPFVVLGLGKLGGGELNYSSDVDLTYLYGGDAAADGSPAPREHFGRLAAEITRAIGEQTVDGLVFRVDLRLRPEGLNGPLVNSLDNAITYYEGWGDTWERGALAKARPVGGNLELGRAFVEQIAPFIYRRHLDFQTIEDFRRMKERIDAEQILKARKGRDVKLCAGGIRELEFIVQALQLIHAGHDISLRVEGTMAALTMLEQAHLIEAEQARTLRDAYRFLRNTEHAVQILEQRQTQMLPADPDGLTALARRLGYGVGRRGAPEGPALETFEADWERHTLAVKQGFARFLEFRAEPGAAREDADAPAAHGKGSVDPRIAALLGMLERGEDEGAAALLEEVGLPEGGRAAATLGQLYGGRVAGPASPQRRRAVESMAPVLLSAAAESADPEAALQRMVDFLVRTGAHTSYMALLGASPATMRILVTLFATSAYLAALLVGHPEILDQLVRSDADPSGRSAAALRDALEEDLVGEPDEEEVMAVLRRFRTLELIRCGMDDLAGVLDAEEVRRVLSSLAEACLRAAADQARRLTAEKLDEPKGLELAIVALGKMGGNEMSYGSDLELLFVYRSLAEGYDDAAHRFATRWVQKTMSILQTRTRDGVVYEIDARLRPSGRSGPLVASLDRFEEYHCKEAELWERQAHIRARVTYGSPALGEKLHELIERFVYGRGLDGHEVGEIDSLRMRVENELANETAAQRNIKTGRGGIVDIETIVQMLLLRHGHDHPEIRVRGTLEAIRALVGEALIEAGEARTLETHYLFLRLLEGRLRLERDRPVEQLGTDAEVIAPLARRMSFSDDNPGGELLTRYEATREEVRSLYEKHFRNPVDV
ncbi:MAG: bifunctional [glutamate--ammonia ligase]-adenylyl-L-tyrosine phosphorylase/[glutamate--ammonia-ligase] adenylyltransferase [Candidatus Binatia bacterium]